MVNEPVTLADIEAAAERIRGAVLRTPCPPSVALSEITGCEIFCKLDYLQRTGSFKERGARNALLLLSPEQRTRGVIAASAGNHASALSFHGKLLNIPVTVVMPRFAPLMKVRTCERMGARVVSHGDDIGAACEHAMELVRGEQLTYINGFDDPAIIAGQGTMGLEILEQVPQCDAVIVPIGGAGLIAGVSLAMKSLRPSVRVIGVQAEHASSFSASIRAGKPVRVDLQPTLADGLAVPRVGDNAFAIARLRVDLVVSVNEHQIALALLRLVELEKAVVEGAGATPLAACLTGLVPELRGKKVVLPLCGGNIDTNMLGRVIERGLAADGRLCRFTARISDRPGGLARFAALLAEEGASVRNIEHDRAFAGDDLMQVVVHCVIETRDHEHVNRVQERLRREGFHVPVTPDEGVSVSRR
ncbi:MAG TPA: threonine ammonia-lyase [Candidatus Acidoferrum sp.]|nr:threonine ammonia-lyase [Candidatus Acidoferrum sp.]